MHVYHGSTHLSFVRIVWYTHTPLCPTTLVFHCLTTWFSEADSLDTVELLMALEEEFDPEIPDEEAKKITTGKFPYDL
jgi:hypothetical protein